MNREVDYSWRLAELMASHDMDNSTDLIPRSSIQLVTRGRHVIASAQAMCPSKPSDSAMSR
jgi:hypothetical protein